MTENMRDQLGPKVSDTKSVVDWHKRLKAEDGATDALHAVAMLGDLLNVGREDGLELNREAVAGMVLTLDRVVGEIRTLLELLQEERTAASAQA